MFACRPPPPARSRPVPGSLLPARLPPAEARHRGCLTNKREARGTCTTLQGRCPPGGGAGRLGRCDQRRESPAPGSGQLSVHQPWGHPTTVTAPLGSTPQRPEAGVQILVHTGHSPTQPLGPSRRSAYLEATTWRGQDPGRGDPWDSCREWQVFPDIKLSNLKSRRSSEDERCFQKEPLGPG